MLPNQTPLDPNNIITLDFNTSERLGSTNAAPETAVKAGKKRKRGFVLTEQGWRKLQQIDAVQNQFGERRTFEELSEKTTLDRRTVSRILSRREGVDRRTLELFLSAFELKLEKQDYAHPESSSGHRQKHSNIDSLHQDMIEAVAAPGFQGRTRELRQLEHWILNDRCRLVAILGMGGVGKTALSVKLAEQIGTQFEYVIWKSLRHAPPLPDILTSLVRFIGCNQDVCGSDTIAGSMTQLMQCLRSHRCLVILDNVETLFQSGSRPGCYRQGYEAYGDLFRWIGEANHQSCFVLTSREKPKEFAFLEDNSFPTRSLSLNGLQTAAGQAMLRATGLQISPGESMALIERYAGNPLALKIVSTTIQNVLGGQVIDFLRWGSPILGDIRELLEQQLDRLTDLERQLVGWLATNRKSISLTDLQEDTVSLLPGPRLLEAIESLRRRSLIEQSIEQSTSTTFEQSSTYFSLQPMVMEYVTESIKPVCQEVVAGKAGYGDRNERIVRLPRLKAN